MVDLLDYDVRFGQGFLFSPPRPVRAEALQEAWARDERRGTERRSSAERSDGVPAAPRCRAGRAARPQAQAAPASESPFAAVSGALAQLRAPAWTRLIAKEQRLADAIASGHGFSRQRRPSPRRHRTHLQPLARAYDVLLCDVWGVVHNGVAAFAGGRAMRWRGFAPAAAR